MVLGVLYGLLNSKMDWVDFTHDWVKPLGIIFVNLLKLIGGTISFSSLIKGVRSLSDVTKFPELEFQKLLLFI